jgi:hypothetical protein
MSIDLIFFFILIFYVCVFKNLVSVATKVSINLYYFVLFLYGFLFLRMLF